MNYKSSIENIDEVTRRLKVTIPVDQVTRELDDALKNLQKNVRLKGFRQGKAPLEMVRQLHGERLRFEVTNKLIDSSLKESLKEHNLDMVGSPEIDLASFEPGKEIEYTANFSVFPKPAVSGYESMNLKVETKSVEENDIHGVIEELRETKATLRKLEFRNQVQKGDVIDSVVSVQVEGQSEDSRPEPTVAPVGEGKLPPVLDEGLIGMEIGSTKEISEVLPDDYSNPELRGKKVVYKVTLNAISEKVLPEVTDEFAKSLQWGVETVLELRIKIREQLEKAAEEGKLSDLHAAILDHLVKQNEFQIPEVLVDDEIRNLLVRNGAVDPSKGNIRELDITPFKEHLGEAATRRVKTAIIVDRIAEIEKIQVEKDDLDSELEGMAQRHQVTKDDLQKFLVKEKMMSGVLLDIQRNKVLRFLADRAKVDYVPASQKEVPASRKE
ncbi:MAG: trigger factor [Deltaproteobacteria bacterium]|nr:trigger factor [Deltaproteobacteria bacterium]